MNTIQLYFKFVAICIRGQMQYRLSFFFQSLGHFLTTVSEFFVVWILFDRFHQIGTWQFAEVAVFYGLVGISFSIADSISTGFERFGPMVRDGSFDRFLLRPRGLVLQIAGSDFAPKRIGRFLQALVVFCWGFIQLEIDVTIWRSGLVAMIILSNVVLFTSLFLVQATISIWTIESLEAMNSLTYGGSQAATYPMAIYSDWIKKFFTYIVPLTCCSYFPVVALLGRLDPLGTSFFFQVVSPLFAIPFALAAGLFWRIGVRHYTSTGS